MYKQYLDRMEMAQVQKLVQKKA